MLVRKILSTPISNDEPSFKRRRTKTWQPPTTVDDDHEDNDDDEEEDEDEDEINVAAQSIQHPQNSVGQGPAKTPIRRTANGMRRLQRKGTRPKRNSSQKSNVALKKSVLLLQQKLLEKQLEQREEERTTTMKFGLALDEFRRHVAEQRMISRGVNVGEIPVDIPPGFQDGLGL